MALSHAPKKDKHDASYYLKCMIGGALACGLTHAALCPLDNVMYRISMNPASFKTMIQTYKTIKATEGPKSLRLGFFPTLVGYSLQGLGKYGFYEIFKDFFADIVGPENAVKYRGVGWAIASTSAEVIADFLLCPWEAVRIRMITSTSGTFPARTFEAMNKIRVDEGTKGLYKNLVPLWRRQIPYTVIKFVTFEKTVETFYKNLFTKPKHEYSKVTQLSITFVSGYIAGILCALLSPPADIIVAKLNHRKNEESIGENIKKIYNNIGFKGLSRSMKRRLLIFSALTGFQWWIYDLFKTLVGLQTTGGVAPLATK